MRENILVGFGFGPIQAGLFVSEAYKSNHFKRIVIAEVNQQLVDAIRAGKGSYTVNVASAKDIRTEHIDGIELLNPMVETDRRQLIEALSQATEIVTSLPSVHYYDMGKQSVARLITQGLKNNSSRAAIIYTAENNNHAAEILEEKVGSFENVQYLNTVIGKMSQVVTDKTEIAQKDLRPIGCGMEGAFLVEEFNNILVTKCRIPDFTPGIRVFIEKEELLPYEEAKLYGHNAIHALLSYLGFRKGYQKMAELKNDAEIMHIAREAFINESGAALIKKYANLKDALFSVPGFRAYADDLLCRMTNPYLGDSVERAARDPQRKLGVNDRLFGTMTLCFEHGIEPKNLAVGAAAGVAYYIRQESTPPQMTCKEALDRLWKSETGKYRGRLQAMTERAFSAL